MPYSPLMVKPMKEELTTLGFNELLTAEDVDSFMEDKSGTAILVINSVCGCAAGQARPGVRQALQHDVKPDRLFTVFAGQEVEATARARKYFADIPPSSPIAKYVGESFTALGTYYVSGIEAMPLHPDPVYAAGLAAGPSTGAFGGCGVGTVTLTAGAGSADGVDGVLMASPAALVSFSLPP